jgi:nicotinic acid phosphoribosyltransferase
LLEKLAEFSFSADDIAYLRSLSFFEDAFLDYLADFPERYTRWTEGRLFFPLWNSVSAAPKEKTAHFPPLARLSLAERRVPAMCRAGKSLA